MQLDPQELSVRELYGWMVQLITPRPIAWVSTHSKDGVSNLAPYSFFNGVGANPPLVMFCPANDRRGEAKDTLRNVKQNGEFVVNMVTEAMAEQMNQTAAEYGPDADEFVAAGVLKAPSAKVQVPRVKNCKAAMECRVHQILDLGQGPGGANLVIGQIVWLHVEADLFDAEDQFLSEEFDTIGRMGGDFYSRTCDRFALKRPQRPEDAE
ncbi:MAG: flavin reductase family protein [Rubripirellula sp.]|nr:flavin reductase [Rhodopirellula sp.]MCH1439613.1 flavin reductase family protein [Rubripirellula sp.]OUX05754.1 MAG: flavin reductase [Planctomycetaceae bacterium TMED240]